MMLSHSNATGYGVNSEKDYTLTEGGAHFCSYEAPRETPRTVGSSVIPASDSRGLGSRSPGRRASDRSSKSTSPDKLQGSRWDKPTADDISVGLLKSPRAPEDPIPTVAGFHAAIVEGDLPAVHAYIQHACESSTMKRPPSGLDAMLAAEGVGLEGEKKVEAPLEVRDHYGRTPLHAAVAHRKNDIVKALLDGGANANSKDGDGFCPLHRCAQTGNLDVARLLLAPRGISFIMATASVDIPSRKGDYYPLHLACIGGSVEMIHFLIRQGADVSPTDKWGCTPLHRACLEGHLEASRAILDAGADVNAKDSWKCTPLHRACHNGDVAMLEMLVIHGASLSARDDQMELPGQKFGEHVPKERQQAMKRALAAAADRGHERRAGAGASTSMWRRSFSATAALGSASKSSASRYIPPGARATTSKPLGESNFDAEEDVATATQPWRRRSTWGGYGGDRGPDVDEDGRVVANLTEVESRGGIPGEALLGAGRMRASTVATGSDIDLSEWGQTGSDAGDGVGAVGLGSLSDLHTDIFPLRGDWG